MSCSTSSIYYDLPIVIQENREEEEKEKHVVTGTHWTIIAVAVTSSSIAVAVVVDGDDRRVRIMDRVLPSLFARRLMECRAWNLVSRVYRRATTGRDVDDNLGQPQSSPSTSSSSQGEASSSPGRDSRHHPCSSEACRYCRAVEKTLLWEDFTFFLNIYLLIVLSVAIW